MSTIATIAAEYGSQPAEITAALDLGTDYDEHAELYESTEADYREVLEVIANQRGDLR